MNISAQTYFVRSFLLIDEEPSGKSTMLSKPVSGTKATDEDIELLRQIAAGDRAAFAAFYDKYSTLLYSIALKILNDSAEAQDVLQETFLQLWEKAPNFDPALGKASSWVAILARNKAVDKLRASQRRSRLADEAGAQEAIVAEGAKTANESVYGREKSAMVNSALASLPPDQRRPIELAYFSGLSQSEIADVLQEPLGTIKARIRRGLLKLRDQLEGIL